MLNLLTVCMRVLNLCLVVRHQVSCEKCMTDVVSRCASCFSARVLSSSHIPRVFVPGSCLPLFFCFRCVFTYSVGLIANYGAISANHSAISANHGAISANHSAISANHGAISTNHGAISANHGAIWTNSYNGFSLCLAIAVVNGKGGTVPCKGKTHILLGRYPLE